MISIWPDHSNDKDTITLQTDRGEVQLESLRQQMKKALGQPSYSLADFIKPGPSPTASINVQDAAKAPSRREGESTVHSQIDTDGNFEAINSLEEPESHYGYQWADPSYYNLLKKYALLHRNKPTLAEEILWEAVKSKKLGNYKFRRQHIIDKYITDLVCLDKKLIIEIDGLIHQLPENIESDAIRTSALEEKMFKVIRFTNEDVIYKLEKTLKIIADELYTRASIKETSNLSSPFGGQGADYMGAFAVTIHGAREHIDRFAADHDEYNKILVQILADRFVEAFAECLHQQVRKIHWGYEKEETLSNEQLIREEYKGIRPAPGYPACPDRRYSGNIQRIKRKSSTQAFCFDQLES